MLQLHNWANFLSIENHLENNNEIVLRNLTRHVFLELLLKFYLTADIKLQFQQIE